MVRIQDLYWAAGFLEGEGCFTLSRAACQVTAAQVQREPLERLERLFGGSIGRYHSPSNQESNHRPYHVWRLYGVQARGLIMTLYVLMSPKRQAAILRQLDKWKSFVPSHRSLPLACPQGHAYTPENIYTYPDGRHGCKTCARVASKRYQDKRQLASEELRGFINRQPPLATHCKKGHEFTPDNVYQTRKGRECRICLRAGKHEWYVKKRAARGGTPRAAKYSTTHCVQGHEYTLDNTYISPTGTRNCRQCGRVRQAAFRLKSTKQ